MTRLCLVGGLKGRHAVLVDVYEDDEAVLARENLI